jgi:hypothetical protein
VAKEARVIGCREEQGETMISNADDASISANPVTDSMQRNDRRLTRFASPSHGLRTLRDDERFLTGAGSLITLARSSASRLPASP